MPTISVIIPAYNVEKHLERCLDSVCGQSYRDIEIIIVDDGSIDRTAEICDRYASADSRIRVVHKENEGVAAARNTALDMASGDMIAFADADDYYEADMLKKLNESMNTHDADMVVCGYYEEFPDRIDEHGTGRGTIVYDKIEAYKDYFRMGGHIGSGCWNKLIKNTVIKGLRLKKYRMAEDVEWICRVIDNCEKIVCLDYAGYHYVHREDSATWQGFGDANIDILRASDEMVEQMKLNHPELLEHMYAFQAAWYSAQIQVMYKHWDKKRYTCEEEYIKRGLKLNMKEYRFNPYIVRADRIYICSYMLGCYKPVKKLYDILSTLKNGIGSHSG